MRISTHTVTRALRFTAVLNILAALAALIAPDLNASLLLGGDAVMEGLLLRHHMMLWAFILTMGLGYAVAARDPERQTGLLLAAGFGKLSAATIWTEMVVNGSGTMLLLAPIAVDGLLGLLFLAYVLPRVTGRRAD